MSSTTRSFLLGAIVTLLVLAIAAAAFVWSGRYAIGADRPHLPLTLAVIDTLRDHATETAAQNVVVPELDGPAMIAEGAARYAAKCAGCHMAPGKPGSQMREGLYPQPPDLSADGIDNPGEAFWIIKHGIKMSAMPAWGKTHTDAQIWSMVAFLQRLPKMTPAQYAEAVIAGNPSAQQPEGQAQPEHR